MAKKYYAVRKGRKTGIFESWEECKAQVYGFSGPEYKGFAALEDAKAFLGLETEDLTAAGTENPFAAGTEDSFVAEAGDSSANQTVDAAAAYVEGSFDKVSGDFSCGVVFLSGGEETTFYQRFSDRELAAMRNVAGEIKGAESAMRYAKEHGVKNLVIYHDYEGIAKWCNGAWKTNKEGTKAYKAFYEEMAKEMDIRFEKVKGHSGDKYNDMADHLAKKALGIV